MHQGSNKTSVDGQPREPSVYSCTTLPPFAVRLHSKLDNFNNLDKLNRWHPHDIGAIASDKIAAGGRAPLKSANIEKFKNALTLHHFYKLAQACFRSCKVKQSIAEQLVEQLQLNKWPLKAMEVMKDEQKSDFHKWFDQETAQPGTIVRWINVVNCSNSGYCFDNNLRDEYASMMLMPNPPRVYPNADPALCRVPVYSVLSLSEIGTLLSWLVCCNRENKKIVHSYFCDYVTNSNSSNSWDDCRTLPQTDRFNNFDDLQVRSPKLSLAKLY